MSLSAALAVAMTVAAPAGAPSWIVLDDEPPSSAKPAESSWHFDVMPFAWIPSISGDQEADGVEVEGGASLFEGVTELDFGGMVRAEAGKGDLTLRLYGAYVSLETDVSGPIGAGGIEATTEAAIVDASVGYRLLGDSWDAFDRGARGKARPGFLDAFVGARAYWISLDLDFDNLPSVDDSDTWIDPLVGLRGAIYAFDWLRLGAEGTIGGFGVGSDLAWSALMQARFVISRTFYVELGYSVLDIDYSNGDFSLDARLLGPYLGAGFTF